MKIECVLQCANHLGEGPVWDIEEGRLYWVDGTGRRAGKPSIWRLDPRTGNTDNWAIKRDVRALAFRPNGACWRPDGKAFHFADTFQGEMWAYDYDLATGTPANKRLFASFKKDAGVADGSTVDAEGCVWNAQLISGDLVRYAPDGSVERRIGMPVRNITSVVFGGDKPAEID